MTIERPYFLLALILAVVPAILYLSRYVRARRQVFPAADYLFGQDNRPLRKLRSRQIGVTLLRSSLIALVALAFAGPRWEVAPSLPTTDGPKSHILVLDTSPGMTAHTEVELTLWDEAVDQGSAWLTGLGETTRIAVVPCPLHEDFAIRWVSPPQALELLDDIEPVEQRCVLSHTLQRVDAALRESDTTLVLSDFRIPEEEKIALLKLQKRRPSLEWKGLTTPRPNLAIESLQQRDESIHVVLSSDAEVETETELVWRCGDFTKRQSVTLPSGESVSIKAPDLQEAPEGTCSVSVEDYCWKDDNTAWFRLDQTGRFRVILVDGSPSADPTLGPAHYVHSALGALEEHLSVVALSQTELTYDQLQIADLLVLVDPQPLPDYLARGIAEYARRGGGVWLVAGLNLAKWERESPLLGRCAFRLCAASEDHPFHVGWMNRQDPIFTGVREASESTLLSWVHLRHMAVMLTGPKVDVAARFSDGAPALLRVGLGSGELILSTAFPTRDNGNTVFHPVFPMWTHGIVKALLPRRSTFSLPAVCNTGDTCTLPTGSGRKSDTESAKEIPESGKAQEQFHCQSAGPRFLQGGENQTLALVCTPNLGEIRTPTLDMPQLLSQDTDTAQPLSTPSNPDIFLLLAGMLVVFTELWLLMGRHLRRPT